MNTYTFNLNIKLKILNFQHQDLNAQLIQNVQTILHALGKNARIPASPQLVESMLNAGFKGTELSASVGQGMREIPIAFVKNVRSIYFAPQSQSFTGFFLFTMFSWL